MGDNCNCGHCDCNEGCDTRDIILLYDEDGKETAFEVVATLEMDENEYVILIPNDSKVDENNEVEEAYILRIEIDENGEDILVGIDDEEELNKAIAAYEELVEQHTN